MTKYELLKPRYKVKDKWPGMHVEPFHLGQIITLTEHETDGWIHTPNKHVPGSYMGELFFKNYPNLFEPLPWWKDRPVEDMPQYLKVNYTKGVQFHKVINWLHKIGEQTVYEYLNKDGLLLRETTSGTNPATEAEYEAYLTNDPLKQ